MRRIMALVMLMATAATAEPPKPTTQPAGSFIGTWQQMRDELASLRDEVKRLKDENSTLKARLEKYESLANVEPTKHPTTRGTQEPSRDDSTGNTVHVKGYTRKDGTVVQPYDRRPPSRSGRR